MTYQNAVLFSLPPASAWQPGTLTPVPGGVVITKPDQRVVSIQPDGTVADRDPGTAGPWEIAQIDPKRNVLNYNINGVPYGLVYRG